MGDRIFQDPEDSVEGYRAAERIPKNLPVRWCRWVRSVFYLFISIKNVPGKWKNLSPDVQYSRTWLGQRLKNPAPAGVEGYREWCFLYFQIGTTNEA